MSSFSAGCIDLRDPTDSEFTAILIDADDPTERSPLFLSAYVGGVGPIREEGAGFRLYLWMNTDGLSQVVTTFEDSGAIENPEQFAVQFDVLYSDWYRARQDTFVADLDPELVTHAVNSEWDGQTWFAFDTEDQAELVQDIASHTMVMFEEDDPE